MRIREKYKKFGFFWLEHEPEQKEPGILSIKDGGYIILELFNHLHSQNHFIGDKKLKHIIGVVEGQGDITLSNCHCISHSYKNGIDTHTLFAKKAFIDYQYKENEKKQFNTFYFYVEGLHQWIPRSWIESQKESSIYKIDNDIHLSFQYVKNTHLEDNTNCLKEQIKIKACCKLFSKKEQSLDKFIAISRKITDFLCFVMNDIVCMDEPVQVASDKMQKKLDKKKVPIHIKLYYESRPFVKNAPKNIQPLFTFKLIENNVEHVINNWIEIYNKTHPALELYFSTQTKENRFLEANFLTLIRSIEAYQQRILDKGLNFKEVLIEIIKPSEKWIANKDVLIDSIKNARDYFTHYNPDKKENKKPYEELQKLYLKLEAIFQINLLKSLKFDDSKIRDIMSSNLKSKIRFESLKNS